MGVYVNKEMPSDLELIIPKYWNEQILTSLPSEEEKWRIFWKVIRSSR